jgi:hypothetical protein
MCWAGAWQPTPALLAPGLQLPVAEPQPVARHVRLALPVKPTLQSSATSTFKAVVVAPLGLTKGVALVTPTAELLSVHVTAEGQRGRRG